MSDPSIPPADGIMCHFFRLPCELRYECYEWALLEPNGLHCRFEEERNAVQTYKMYASLEESLKHDGVESNQLKYVCRQLWNETAGLGLKVNHLHFTHSLFSGRNGTSQLISFLSNCSDRQKQRLRGIDLSTTQDVEEQQTAAQRQRSSEQQRAERERGKYYSMPGPIRHFLTDYQNATVYLQLYSGGEQQPDSYITLERGITYRSVHRGRDYTRLLRRPMLLAFIAHESEKYRKNISPSRKSLPNFRWRIPYLEFDEAEFRKQWREKAPSNYIGENEVETWLDACIAEMKSWVEHGL